MARRTAKLDGLTHVECLLEEVFTGMLDPERMKKGQRAHLPLGIAADLIKAKAAKNV